MADDLIVGGAVGAAGLVDWWNVDDNVLQAISHLAGEQITSAANMWGVVSDYPNGLSDGFLMSLRGHVGEQMAAEHFGEAGLEVGWPDAANQPGWDLNLDGHLANVKVTADAGRTAAEHFSSHPEIPVVINADAAHLPESAIHFDPAVGIDPSVLVGDHLVVVDNSLSLHDAASSVSDAFGLDNLTGDLADPGIPVVGVLIAAVTSGIREGKLVRNGSTSGSRAIKNVAVDTTGRGVGVIAGFKAGAATGAMIDVATGGATLGLATLLLGLGGAVGGARLGSAAARKIRGAPLRAARSKMDLALGAYGKAVEREQRTVSDTISRKELHLRVALAARALLAQRTLESELRDAQAAVRVARHVDSSLILTDLKAGLVQQIADLDPSLISKTRAPAFFSRRELARAFKLWERQLQESAPEANDDPEHAERFWDVAAAVPEGRDAMMAHICHVRRIRASQHARCAQTAVNLTAQLQAARTEGRARYNNFATVQVDDAQIRLEPLATNLQSEHENFVTELLAAGIDPEPGSS